MEIISEFTFEDLNIWDAYNNWEDYLKDKSDSKIPVFKLFNKEDQSNFYLNYNPKEGNKTEIYCNPDYYSQELVQRLEEIVNRKQTT